MYFHPSRQPLVSSDVCNFRRLCKRGDNGVRVAVIATRRGSKPCSTPINVRALCTCTENDSACGSTREDRTILQAEESPCCINCRFMRVFHASAIRALAASLVANLKSVGGRPVKISSIFIALTPCMADSPLKVIRQCCCTSSSTATVRLGLSRV